MNKSFHALLDKVSYDRKSDVLIHVGDIVTKGPRKGSMGILSFMTKHNVLGVRGNHDQQVVEWRGWIDWVRHQSAGKRWLENVELDYVQAEVHEKDVETWLEMEMETRRSKWWKRIPKGWKLFGEHYWIARGMSKEQYKYLLSLPLVLHASAAHTFVVHGGMLPSDPNYKPHDTRQPLARTPVLPAQIRDPSAAIPLLRELQEAAILSDVPQNVDPWVLLNMRGVKSDHSVTRGQGGQVWSKLWNQVISQCHGFDGFEDNASADSSLQCMPSTVVYGHSAARGLDAKRWSVGLDTGCILITLQVYTRRLTALVVQPLKSSHVEGDSMFEDHPVSLDEQMVMDHFAPNAEIASMDDTQEGLVAVYDVERRTPSEEDISRFRAAKGTIPFGDHGKGVIVSVKCS
ncbi:hypothetical protein FISHEDRAFT_67746 [Fistulina hepatica ATCC 64428]|nr:hypothetical protein FISHEDRAFT_67746 [Fistulina hepatica ATCC 64428]